jgi:hypothetical protein
MTDGKFQVLSSDVSGLPKAPDLTFVIDQTGEFMVARYGDWVVVCKELDEVGRHGITISLDGAIYAACEYIETESPYFKEQSSVEQVSGFAAGLFWSAWRRWQLKSPAKGGSLEP